MDPPETSDTSQGTTDTVTGISAFKQNQRRARRNRGGVDTSPNHDDIYQDDSQNLHAIPELPDLGEVYGTLDAVPDTPAGLTPLTGMSSELQANMSRERSSNHSRDPSSEDETTDSDIERALDAIWGMNNITNEKTMAALTSRVRRRLDQALQLDGDRNPTFKEYIKMAKRVATLQARRHVAKQRERGRDTVSVSTGSIHTPSRDPTPDGRDRKRRVDPLGSPRIEPSKTEIVGPSGPTDSTSQESGPRPQFTLPPTAGWGKSRGPEEERQVNITGDSDRHPGPGGNIRGWIPIRIQDPSRGPTNQTRIRTTLEPYRRRRYGDTIVATKDDPTSPIDDPTLAGPLPRTSKRADGPLTGHP